MKQRTLSIVKPDAVLNGHIGAILNRFEKAGLKIVASKMMWLTPQKAREFYAVHSSRPFFESLVSYMVSGPIVVSVLEGDDAIAQNRKIMGATDPAKAEAGTLRRDFGVDIEKNAAHGSDSPETAAIEIPHFFSQLELQAYERNR